MSQTWDATAPDEDNDWDDDLPAMKNNFAALQSNFLGTSAPTSPVGGQGWTDSGSTTHKRRDSANAAWLADLHGDASFKIPVYRNDTCDGWTIDATVTDRVIALKGGSDAYNANGGTNAGTAWSTISGHTHAKGSFAAAAHNHLWLNPPSSDISNDEGYNSSGTLIDIAARSYAGGAAFALSTDGENRLTNVDLYTSNASPALSGTSAASSISDARPAAALCTLQYPDMT